MQKTKHKSRRLLSMLLTLAIALTFAPVFTSPAFAADPDPKYFGAWSITGVNPGIPGFGLIDITLTIAEDKVKMEWDGNIIGYSFMDFEKLQWTNKTNTDDVTKADYPSGYEIKGTATAASGVFLSLYGFTIGDEMFLPAFIHVGGNSLACDVDFGKLVILNKTTLKPKPASITGPTYMALPVGYAATSTESFSVGGTDPVTVTKSSGNDAITWDNATRKLSIAEGLTAGKYKVTLKASNTLGSGTTDFTLAVFETHGTITQSSYYDTWVYGGGGYIATITIAEKEMVIDVSMGSFMTGVMKLNNVTWTEMPNPDPSTKTDYPNGYLIKGNVASISGTIPSGASIGDLMEIEVFLHKNGVSVISDFFSGALYKDASGLPDEPKPKDPGGDSGGGCNSGVGALWAIVMLTGLLAKRKF